MTQKLSSIYKKFPSNSECIVWLEKIRWHGTPLCPKCGYSKFSPVKGKQAYRCNMCNRTFSVTNSTIFHKSKIDLQKWFYVIRAMLDPTNEATVRELAQDIDVAKDTAWSMQKKIKTALINSPHLLFEIDKTLKV